MTTEDDDDVPIRVDFRDPTTARTWVEETRTKRPYRPRFFGRVVSAECQRVDRRLVREDMKQRHRIERWSVRDAGDEIEIEAGRGNRVVIARVRRSAITGVDKPWPTAIEPAIRELVGQLDTV